MNPQLIQDNQVDNETDDNDLIMKSAEREEQIGFIRKVLGIVAAQLFVTFLMTLFASGTKMGEEFFKRPIVGVTGVILLTTSFLVLICSKHTRRTVP